MLNCHYSFIVFVLVFCTKCDFYNLTGPQDMIHILSISIKISGYIRVKILHKMKYMISTYDAVSYTHLYWRPSSVQRGLLGHGLTIGGHLQCNAGYQAIALLLEAIFSGKILKQNYFRYLVKTCHNISPLKMASVGNAETSGTTP